mgnify:CR=1 FL=1
MKKLQNYLTTLATITLMGCQTVPREKQDAIVPVIEGYSIHQSRKFPLERIAGVKAGIIQMNKQDDGTFKYTGRFSLVESKLRFERSLKSLLHDTDTNRDKFISPEEVKEAEIKTYKWVTTSQQPTPK